MDKRTKNLFKDGAPKWVRCYDNGGETLDRYTVVFTKKRVNGRFYYLGMSSNPYMGVGMRGESDVQIDRPAYSHLGKRCNFVDLPENCQDWVTFEYCEIWGVERKH